MFSLLAQLSDPSDIPTVVPDAAATAAVVGLGIGMWVFLLLFVGVGFIIWIIALIDVIRREFDNPNDKTLWLIIVILLYWVGGLVYLIAGRKKGHIPGAKASQ